MNILVSHFTSSLNVVTRSSRKTNVDKSSRKLSSCELEQKQKSIFIQINVLVENFSSLQFPVTSKEKFFTLFGIDHQARFEMNLKGVTTADGFKHWSLAAVAGDTTTVIDLKSPRKVNRCLQLMSIGWQRPTSKLFTILLFILLMVTISQWWHEEGPRRWNLPALAQVHVGSDEIIEKNLVKLLAKSVGARTCTIVSQTRRPLIVTSASKLRETKSDEEIALGVWLTKLSHKQASQCHDLKKQQKLYWSKCCRSELNDKPWN